MKNFFFVCIVSIVGYFLFTFFSFNQNQKIPFNHQLIQYSGAFVKTDDNMLFAYSGCNINFKTNSKSLILIFNDYSILPQSNYVRVEVNNKDTILQLLSNVKKYDVSSLISQKESLVRIFKLTEASIGKIEFEGLKIDEGAELLSWQLPKNKIVWIGNSITTGYGNEVSVMAPPKGNPNTGFNSKNQNNYKAWGSIASRICDAQAIHLCYSGKGLYRNFDGSNKLLIHQFMQKAIPQEDIDIVASSVNAPIYVVHAGTNDFGYEGANPQFKVDSILFVNGMHKVFKVIESWNSTADIIVVSSNMVSDFFPKNGQKRFKNYVNSAVQNFDKKSLKFHFLELKVQSEPYGENWHPSAHEHELMAKQIVPMLKSIIQ